MCHSTFEGCIEVLKAVESCKLISISQLTEGYTVLMLLLSFDSD